MAIINIALLHFQQVFHHRLRSFVWFLIPLLNQPYLILFWRGALSTPRPPPMDHACGHRLLFSVDDCRFAPVFPHRRGCGALRYPVRRAYQIPHPPLPYYWIKFIEEIPYRILQGFYGVILVILFTLFFGTVVRLSGDPVIVLSCLIMCVLAFFLSFTLKMNLGMSAFWFKDSRGFFELITIVMIVFSGGIIPIHFLPAY
jgi:hypothetical protein